MPATGRSTRPSTIPASSRTSAPSSADTGAVRAARRHQGPGHLHRDVARLRSRQPDALLHDRQRRVSRPRRASTRRRSRTTLLQKDARIGDLAFNRADQSLWGIRHLNGICTLVRIAPPYRDWERVMSLPYGTVVYDLDVSPDGRQVVASFGEISGQQDVRVLPTRSARAGRRDADRGVRLRHRGAEQDSCSRPTAGICTAARTTRASSNIFRYEIATSEARGRDEHRDRLLPAGAARRRVA